jgi:hypothetical protein
LTAPKSFTRGAEGPAVDKDGNLYAVNFSREGTVGKISSTGEGSIFIEVAKMAALETASAFSSKWRHA